MQKYAFCTMMQILKIYQNYIRRRSMNDENQINIQIFQNLLKNI